jgi:hypothetical protein
LVRGFNVSGINAVLLLAGKLVWCFLRGGGVVGNFPLSVPEVRKNYIATDYRFSLIHHYVPLPLTSVGVDGGVE